MKKLIFKLVLPLTLISVGLFTKWWYVSPDNAPDIILWGFPLPFAGDGFQTSMSLQIFVMELIIDLLVFFCFWFLVVFSINRFIIKIRVKKIITILVLSLAGFFLTNAIFDAWWPDNMIKIKRDWNMETMETGYKFIWQKQPRPDYTLNPPRIRKE